MKPFCPLLEDDFLMQACCPPPYLAPFPSILHMCVLPLGRAYYLIKWVELRCIYLLHTCYEPMNGLLQMPSPVQEVPGGSPIPGRDILKRRRTYQEHRGLLESFMRYREVLKDPLITTSIEYLTCTLHALGSGRVE